MKTKFLHIRNRDNEGKIISNGGRTVAYYVDEEGFVWAYAVAKCHPSDNFDKQVGRDKASGRLYSERHTQACHMKEYDFCTSIYSKVWY